VLLAERREGIPKLSPLLRTFPPTWKTQLMGGQDARRHPVPPDLGAFALARGSRAAKTNGHVNMKFFWQALSLVFLAANLGCRSTGAPTAPSTTRGTNPDSTLFKEKLAQADKGDAQAQYSVGKYYALG
jgi:hypothetical protein